MHGEDGHIRKTFGKAERLCSKKIIGRLFSEGSVVYAYPLKIIYLRHQMDTGFPVQAGFSVGKKTFKKAVQRNLLKRRMREAYRLNKHELNRNIQGDRLAVFFVFTGKSLSDFSEIEAALQKGIRKLLKKQQLPD